MSDTPSPSSPRLTILVDGLCPLCRMEGDMLRKLDRGRGLLSVVDFTQSSVDVTKWGLTFDQVMGQIHGIHHHGINHNGTSQSGTISTGMQVFRDAYSLVGWGWLWAPTGWPILKPIFDRFYIWFAKNRLRLTGRKDECGDGRCVIKS